LRNHPDKGGSAELFKSVAACRDVLVKNFGHFKKVASSDYDSDTYSEFEYESDDSDETYTPKPGKKSKSKANKNNNSDYITKEKFETKECVSGRGGWLQRELIEFCSMLGIKTSGTKKDLCNKLKMYFNETDTGTLVKYMSEMKLH
jgi:hypothetical protein